MNSWYILITFKIILSLKFSSFTFWKNKLKFTKKKGGGGGRIWSISFFFFFPFIKELIDPIGMALYKNESLFVFLSASSRRKENSPAVLRALLLQYFFIIILMLLIETETKKEKKKARFSYGGYLGLAKQVH